MRIGKYTAVWVLGMVSAITYAQNVLEVIRLDEGWKFALGNAADPAKDFGCGTEYFNYLRSSTIRTGRRCAYPTTG